MTPIVPFWRRVYFCNVICMQFACENTLIDKTEQSGSLQIYKFCTEYWPFYCLLKTLKLNSILLITQYLSLYQNPVGYAGKNIWDRIPKIPKIKKWSKITEIQQIWKKRISRHTSSTTSFLSNTQKIWYFGILTSGFSVASKKSHLKDPKSCCENESSYGVQPIKFCQQNGGCWLTRCNERIVELQRKNETEIAKKCLVFRNLRISNCFHYENARSRQFLQAQK